MQLGSTIPPLSLLCALFLFLILVAMETAEARGSASASASGPASGSGPASASGSASGSAKSGGGSKRCRGKRRNSRRCRNAALTQGQSGVRALQDGPGKENDPHQQQQQQQQEEEKGSSLVSVVKKSRRKGGGGGKGNEKSPPAWHKQPPKDKLFIQRDGSEAVFKCKAVGQPRPKVTWFKDGEVVKVKKNKKYRKGKWKLQVSEVTIGDSGNYTCKVVNSEGILEWTYTLRVLEMKPISDINIIERPKNQTALVGDTVLFRCRSDTWPAPSMYWAKKLNNKLVVEIIPRDNNTLAEDLVIDNVSKADAGEYTCYIGNNISNLRLSATLTVIEEEESLPFEPKCALHVRRQVYVDSTYGCQTEHPVELNYCMGSCGRSYYIPEMMTTDEHFGKLLQPVNQTCQCCVGHVQGIRIVPLRCPSGKRRNGFFPFFRDCTCASCSFKDAFFSGEKPIKL